MSRSHRTAAGAGSGAGGDPVNHRSDDGDFLDVPDALADLADGSSTLRALGQGHVDFVVDLAGNGAVGAFVSGLLSGRLLFGGSDFGRLASAEPTGLTARFFLESFERCGESIFLGSRGEELSLKGFDSGDEFGDPNEEFLPREREGVDLNRLSFDEAIQIICGRQREWVAIIQHTALLANHARFAQRLNTYRGKGEKIHLFGLGRTPLPQGVAPHRHQLKDSDEGERRLRPGQDRSGPGPV